jgi:hypothetical protein
MKSGKATHILVKQWRGWTSIGALAILVLGAAVDLPAEKRGITLQLECLDGKQTRGELLAVKGERLILQIPGGLGAEIGIRDVARIRIVRRSRVGKGLATGVMIGMALGGIAGVPFVMSDDNEVGLLPIAILGGLLGGIGGIVGAGTSLLAGLDESAWLPGESEPRLAALLERLRRLARFCDTPAAATGTGSKTVDRASDGTAVKPPATPGKALQRPSRVLRFHLGLSFIQRPPYYSQAVLSFLSAFRYPGQDPVRLEPNRFNRMENDHSARFGWAGPREVRLDYFLEPGWMVGILAAPFPEFQHNSIGSQYSLRRIRIQSQACFLVFSRLFPAPDGFWQKDSLRLQAGLGMNWSGVDYEEGGDSYEPDSEYFYYGAKMARVRSRALSALAKAELVHCFNRRWSLALGAGFRYAPLRIPEQEVIGRIKMRPPYPDESFAFRVPKYILNTGGFHLDASLGFRL